MSSLAEEFVTLDKDNHARMKGAIETAMSADFKVEKAPKHDSTVVFSKKPLEFFVREKLTQLVLSRLSLILRPFLMPLKKLRHHRRQ